MKQILYITIFCLLVQPASSQVLKGLGEKAKAKIGQRANNKVDNAMDKGLDGVENGVKVKKDGDGDVKVKDEDGSKIKVSIGAAPMYTSKYDFVPGEKIVLFEDFSNTAIGDFPVNWNTNATAEVVKLNNKEGNWMKIQKEGIFHPELVKSLPDNFTLELDVAVSNNFDSEPFVVNIGTITKPTDYTDYGHHVQWRGRPALHLEFKPHNGRVSAWSRLLSGKDGNHHVDNTVEYKEWDNTNNTFAHLSLWRQKERLRVYVNGQKIWDSPKAFLPEGKYNAITFAMQGSYKPNDFYVINNLRLAVGAADTRNKLITEGKFVSRGILFDVNSDRIKAESSGALKDIANVLKENAGVQVKIIGHTDSDGDEAKNLELSKRRAASVKNYLVKEHGINADNLETDGKGETQPVDKNLTAEGKANNRRVEFIRQ